MSLRTSRTTALAAVLLVALMGLGTPAAVAEEAAGAVTGTVTFDGEPVVGAQVHLTPSVKPGGMWALTDAAGEYLIDDVPPGDYAARVNNYLIDQEAEFDFLTTYSGDTVRMPDAVRHTVSSGASTTIDINPVEGAAITGKVRSPNGDPVVDAWVRAVNTDRAGFGVTRTDASGNYVIKGLASGKVVVVATGPDAPEDEPFAEWTAQGTKSVKAKQGRTKTVKTITIPRLGKLKGKVKGLKKGDAVYAFNTKTKTTLHLKTATQRGSLSINAKLPAGKYRVVVGGTNKGTKAVRVKSGKTTRFAKLTVPTKRTKVRGKIRAHDGALLAGAYVTVLDKFGIPAGNDTSNATGRYSIKGVVSGKYTVSVIDSSDQDADTAVKIKVKKGKHKRQHVTMGKGYRIKGTITFDGAPVDGLSIGASAGWDTSDALGKYKLKNLARGKHVVTVHDPWTGGYLDASKTIKLTRNRTVNLVLETR